MGYSQAVGSWDGLGPPTGVWCAGRNSRHRGTEPLPGRRLLNGAEVCAIFQIKPGVVFLHKPILSVLPRISQALAPCLCPAPPPSQCGYCVCAKCPSWNSSSIPDQPQAWLLWPAPALSHSSRGLSHSPHPPAQPQPCLWGSPDFSYYRLRSGVKAAQGPSNSAH